MKKAFVDTTILVNILLKTGELKEQATAALQSFEQTELPVYAIKEFSAGALQSYAYCYNVLVESATVAHAIERIKKVVHGGQKSKGMTAWDALIQAMRDSPISSMIPEEMAEKYGAAGNIDSIQKDQYRLAIKARIGRAWRKRRSVTTHVVEELPCFLEKDPTEERGVLKVGTKPCNGDCAAAERLKQAPDLVKTIVNALKEETKDEVAKRRKTLKGLVKNPDRKVPQEECRKLGDAVFVILAPQDAVILTTNIKDFEPMAKACRKKVVAPSDLFLPTEKHHPRSS